MRLLCSKFFAILGLCSINSLYAVEHECPNIVVMFVDDLGCNDLGYKNPSFHTPNINELAQNSIDFINAYVPSPTSSPSRVGLLTGRYPVKVGFTRHIDDNAFDPFGTGEYGMFRNDPGKKPSRQFLPLDEITFAEVLKKSGYTTCAIGKWHLGGEKYYPQKQGFDIVYGESDLGHPVSYFEPYFTKSDFHDKNGKYLTDYLTDSAIEVIKTHDYKKTPLCMYLAHYGVHSPIQAPQKIVDKYLSKGIKGNYATYHAMVEAIDNSVGNILQAIKDSGQEDNTIFVFTSDQGGLFTNYPYRGGKMVGTALYEGGARIPFIISIPGHKPQSIKERVTTLDIFPTLLDLVGCDVSEYPQLDGISLMQIIDEHKEISRPLFSYRSYDDQVCFVILDDLKLIYTRSGNHELFDLKKDPFEQNNIYGNILYNDKRNELVNIVEDFLKKYEPKSVEISK